MDTPSKLNIPLANMAFALLTVILLGYLLYIGTSILLPILTAVVIWYMLTQLTNLFLSLPVIGLRLPYSLALFLAFIATGLILYGLGLLVSQSIYGIIDNAPKYQARLAYLLNLINTYTHAQIEFAKIINSINFTSLFSNLAYTLTALASNLGLIIVYVMFLLLEYKTFDNKLRALARDEARYKNLRAIFDKINNDINAYMKIKTGVSLLTAGLSYLLFILFGVHYAQFWALLIFLLNFIPTIGSIIAIIITLLAISVQFTHVTPYIVIGLSLITIQFVIGNFIEPRFMGTNLNLSPIIILISLAFWGSIWGVIGMFLCVPLMTIINIVLSKFEGTHEISILLAGDPGKIDLKK